MENTSVSYGTSLTDYRSAMLKPVRTIAVAPQVVIHISPFYTFGHSLDDEVHQEPDRAGPLNSQSAGDVGSQDHQRLGALSFGPKDNS
jgi:hypothetical protein